MTPTPRPDVLAALRACRLWRTAGDAAVARLAAAATVQEAPRGSVLAAEGDPADRFGVVVVGRVRVYHLTADGRTVLLEALESGDAFAAAASLAGGRNPAYVDAATPVSVAWLDREALFAVLDDDPSVAYGLLTTEQKRFAAEQFVPFGDREALLIDAYETFINHRAKHMAGAINQFLGL